MYNDCNAFRRLLETCSYATSGCSPSAHSATTLPSPERSTTIINMGRTVSFAIRVGLSSARSAFSGPVGRVGRPRHRPCLPAGRPAVLSDRCSIYQQQLCAAASESTAADRHRPSCNGGSPGAPGVSTTRAHPRHRGTRSPARASRRPCRYAPATPPPTAGRPPAGRRPLPVHRHGGNRRTARTPAQPPPARRRLTAPDRGDSAIRRSVPGIVRFVLGACHASIPLAAAAAAATAAAAGDHSSNCSAALAPLPFIAVAAFCNGGA